MAVNPSPPSSARQQRWDQFLLGDVEAIRLLLDGGSVIDWHRLHFGGMADVERFLRVNEFRLDNEMDIDRLEELRAEAVEYLRNSLQFQLLDDLANEVSVPDLLLIASSPRGRRQTMACIVLKVMHVLHHLAGRELLFKLPVSDDQIFHLVENKVVQVVDALRAAGHPVIEFSWSRKERDSLITKLLAKKESIAAHVYDKLRFRLVVREEEDIIPVVRELHHRLIPFNYIIPGESINQIVSFDELIDQGQLQRFKEALNKGAEPRRNSPANEFSGPGFRVINFVADLPIRVDSFVGDPIAGKYAGHGQIIFVLTEFQVMDEQVAIANEHGENSHERYKDRQHGKVKARLTGGIPIRGEVE